MRAGLAHAARHDPPFALERIEALLDRVEEATLRLLDAQLERARRIVAERREGISLLVERLLERDTLSAGEIRECFPSDRRAAA